MNSSEYKNVGGTETYYNPISSNGKSLAAIIQSKIASEVNWRRELLAESLSILK